MKADIYDIEGKKVKSVELPKQFNEEYRPDIILRAFLAIMSHDRQPYGAKQDAGEYASKLSRRRRDFKTAYGHGMSRVPRKTILRRGRHFFFVGATSPNTRGGRRAHPPKSEKIWDQKINIKERRKAIRSAIAATSLKDVVKERGHKFYDVPVIIEDKFESITKTKDVRNVLLKLGLKEELKRIETRKVRAGKGKLRGRKYRTKVGPLIVVSSESKLLKSGRNIQGVDVVDVKKLNAKLLAPGGHPGRLCLWTNKAIEIMKKDNLFY